MFQNFVLEEYFWFLHKLKEPNQDGQQSIINMEYTVYTWSMYTGKPLGDITVIYISTWREKKRI